MHEIIGLHAIVLYFVSDTCHTIRMFVVVVFVVVVALVVVVASTIW